MDRVTLNEQVNISRIVYGMWRLGDDADTSPAHVQAKVEACLEQGITTMDQADIYGGYMAEEILGAALRAAPALKDKIEIVTKCDIVAPAGRHSGARVKYYDTSRAHIEASVDGSLRLMDVDVIDVLLIHRPDPFMDHYETGAALDDLIAAGKIKSAGVSNFRPWDWSLLQSAMQNKLVTNQIELSVLTHDAFVNGDLAHLQQNAVPPMAWSPLAGGELFQNQPVMDVLRAVAEDQECDPTSVAVAWLLAHPAQIVPVMGTNTLSRIATLAEATRVAMDRETWYEIYTVALGREVA